MVNIRVLNVCKTIGLNGLFISNGSISYALYGIVHIIFSFNLFVKFRAHLFGLFGEEGTANEHTPASI